jgi:hypothetical protein
VRAALVFALLCAAFLNLDASGTAADQAGPVTAGGYTVGATLSPNPVVPGSAASIVATVESSTDSTVLVDVEVHDSSGAKVFQDYLDNQTVTAGATATFPFSWPVPADQPVGAYTLMVGVFSPNWEQNYAFDSDAAQLAVGSAGAPVAAAAPADAWDFSLSASPGTMVVPVVSKNRSIVSVTSLGGFDAPITFTVAGFPPDANAYVLPEPLKPVPGDNGGTLTIVSGATRGNFLLTITANGGGKSHTTLVSLVIH